jgi:hypothetical protein
VRIDRAADVAIGIIALLGGYFYSAPPLKLEGRGWGEWATAILTAVLVPLTGYVMQANYFDPIVLIVCAPFVLIYVAMILTFEFPDYPADKALGKKTITVRIGLRRARGLHNGFDRRPGMDVVTAPSNRSCAWSATGRVADRRSCVAPGRRRGGSAPRCYPAAPCCWLGWRPRCG